MKKSRDAPIDFTLKVKVHFWWKKRKKKRFKSAQNAKNLHVVCFNKNWSRLCQKRKFKLVFINVFE